MWTEDYLVHSPIQKSTIVINIDGVPTDVRKCLVLGRTIVLRVSMHCVSSEDGVHIQYDMKADADENSNVEGTW